jgi:histidinol-phosphate aminotransferase
MSRYRRPSLGADFGYTPGEQPPDSESWVKLNTNESPLSPSPAVADAVRDAAGSLQRYPHPRGEPLRSALARHHGVDTAQVAVGNGADALLATCFAAFCEPGSTLVTTAPTYTLLDTLATLHSVVHRAVPLAPGGRLPRAFATEEAAMRCIVNPNSPTGTWIAPPALEEVLRDANGVLVIDEAYGDFAPASCIPLVAEHPAWLVLRTFSKSYALAGLRVGYAVGSPDLVADLDAAGDSYALDRCAIAGACAALGDERHHHRIVDTVRSERARLTTALLDRGWELTASQANFVCATPPGGAAAVFARLRARRILVRHFCTPATGDVLRITIGTPEQNDALLAAL